MEKKLDNSFYTMYSFIVSKTNERMDDAELKRSQENTMQQWNVCSIK